MPRYEYSEGTSNKFWEIALSGPSYTSRWGKIGGSVSSSTKRYKDAAAAKQAYDKLIAEKVKKGYTLVGGKQAGKPAKAAKPAAPARNAELEKAIRANPEDAEAYLVYADWMQANGDIRGELAVLQHAGKQKQANALLAKHEDWFLAGFPKKHRTEIFELEWFCGFIKNAKLGWASFGYGYDDDAEPPDPGDDRSWYERCRDSTVAFLKLPSAQFIQELELGPMPGDEECSLDCFAQAIDDAKPPTLRALTIANTGEWDISSTSTAMPDSKSIKHLRSLRLGGGSPTIGKIDLPELRSFAVQTGGLGKKALANIAAAKWPQLERLEIWTGDPEYGSTCTAKQLAPIFAATGLPKLRHLHLKNCAFADAAIKLLVHSKLLRQLETLDLSMGNVSDKGVAVMIENRAAFAHLARLDLDDSALDDTTEKMVKGLAKKVTMLGQTPDRAVPRTGERTWARYTAVGE